MVWLPLALGLAAASGGDADAPVRRYSALSATDVDRFAEVLYHRVATVELRIRPQPDLLIDPDRIVFGIVIDPQTVATVAQLCSDATSVQIRGPDGRLPARFERLDLERRVALVVTERPLSEIGLVVSPPLKKDERREDAEVFALVNTDPGAGVVHGVIAQVGLQPEYEGHPRTTLDLSFGMPVFDGYGRWVGYARTVAWDQDQRMLIPPDKVRLSQTATASGVKAAKKPRRPWWAR